MSKALIDYKKRFGSIRKAEFSPDGKEIIIEFRNESDLDYAISNLHIAIVRNVKDSKHNPISLLINRRNGNKIILDSKVRNKENISHIKIFHVGNKTTYKVFKTN